MSTQARSVRLVAIAALGSGLISLVVVNLGGKGSIGGGFDESQSTIYGPAHTALALALAITGLVLLVTAGRNGTARRDWVNVALLGVIGLCSSQLAGIGFVANRRWPLFWGCCTTNGVTHQELVRNAALAMGVICALTAIACLLVLRRHGKLEWRGWVSAVALLGGLFLAIAIPLAMEHARKWDSDWFETSRDLVGAALTYSLPFAVTLALSGLMVRRAAIVVAAAVAVDALIATAGDPFLDLRLPFSHPALAVTVLAAVVIAFVRLAMPSRTRIDTA